MPNSRWTTNVLRSAFRGRIEVRRLLGELRQLCFTADPCPLPALEMLIAEMLAIHFCSDHNETVQVLAGLLEEVRRRADARVGVLPVDAVRLFWVNPVADLRVMNLLEDVGGRVCGADNMFCHALDPIPTDLPPLGSPGADGAGRSDGRLGGGQGRADLLGGSTFRRPRSRHLAHPRRQPLRDGGDNHRRGDPRQVGRSGDRD